MPSKPTRTLLIEVQDDGITSVEEPTVEDCLDWIREQGHTFEFVRAVDPERVKECNGNHAFVFVSPRTCVRCWTDEPGNIHELTADELAAEERNRALDTSVFDIEATCSPGEAEARIAKAKVERAKMMGEPVSGAAGKVIGTATGVGVEKRPGVMGGSACITGTRLPVTMLVGLRNRGYDDAKFLEFYPHLRVGQLADAWAYYEANRGEIDAELAEDEDYGTELQDATDEQLKRELERRGNEGGTATEEGRREGKMPSERAIELAGDKSIGVWEVLAVLDERLGVGP